MQMNQIPQWPLMAHGRRVALLLLLAGGVAGCQNSMMLSQATPQPTVSEKYPISVEPVQETMQLSPVLAGNKLAPADARQVTAFAGGFLQKGHGPLAIILPNIPYSPRTQGQMQAINEILAERGVPASRIEWRIATPGAAPAAAAAPPGGVNGTDARPGPLVFSFTRYVASAEGACGNWEKDIGRSHDNHTWDNFGCAHQHNLAVMVADPLDLKRPRATTPVDVDRRTVVIKAYREGKTTSSERSEDEKGTVSDVSK